MRGYLKSNVEYSISTSKRKIGAFAVKGWISGRSYSTMVERASTGNIPSKLLQGFIPKLSSGYIY